MKNNIGLTLIELILVIVLVGIISGFIGSILYKETDAFKIMVTRKEKIDDSLLAVQRILKDLKNAYSGGGSSLIVGNNVRFKIPYNPYNNYTSVNVFTTGGNLYLRVNNGLPQLLAKEVVFFNVTTLRANYSSYSSIQNTRNLVTVKLVLSKDNQLITYQSAAYLRNRR